MEEKNKIERNNTTFLKQKWHNLNLIDKLCCFFYWFRINQGCCE